MDRQRDDTRMHARRFKILLEHPPIGDGVGFCIGRVERQLDHFAQREGAGRVAMQTPGHVSDAIHDHLVVARRRAQRSGGFLNHDTAFGHAGDVLEVRIQTVYVGEICRRQPFGVSQCHVLSVCRCTDDRRSQKTECYCLHFVLLSKNNFACRRSHQAADPICAGSKSPARPSSRQVGSIP